MEVREATHTADDLVQHVRAGVEGLVRDALEEAHRLHSEADETLARYDEIVHEMTSLRAEIFGLRRDLEELPDRLAKARLGALVDDPVGEDPALLERRYVAARERLPVAEQRLSRLESELASIGSAGSRPAKVEPDGGQRRLVKHESRASILDGLTEIVQDLERLRNQLPDVVGEAADPLIKERDQLRDGQNQLWGLAKRR